MSNEVSATHMATPALGHTHPQGEVDLCFAVSGAPRFHKAALANGGSVDPNLHLDGLLPMQPVGVGLQHFVMRLDDPAKNAAVWKQLPPLTGAITRSWWSLRRP